MPRDNDTDNEKGTDAKLRFSAVIECPECGTEFEGTWEDDAIDVEQIVDPPEGRQKCPNPECGHEFDETYPGWFNYSDAG